MSAPNLDFIQPTLSTVSYELCGTAQDTLSVIEWEPDGRSTEQSGFDDIPFSIIIET